MKQGAARIIMSDVRVDEVFVMELEGKGRTWPWKSDPGLARPV